MSIRQIVIERLNAYRKFVVKGRAAKFLSYNWT